MASTVARPPPVVGRFQCALLSLATVAQGSTVTGLRTSAHGQVAFVARLRRQSDSAPPIDVYIQQLHTARKPAQPLETLQ
eukprot:COSAG06_NODE_1954_length_7985_cov_27.960817_4_plen_80_part_00